MKTQKSTKKPSQNSTDQKVDDLLMAGFTRLARITPMAPDQMSPEEAAEIDKSIRVMATPAWRPAKGSSKK
jgi:hypothetical protein